MENTAKKHIQDGYRKKSSAAPESNLIKPEDAIQVMERLQGPDGPEFYFESYLGVKAMWEGEREMLRALPRAIKEGKPMVVGSGHALGKDFTISGGATLWFIHAYGPNCKVAMTGPTDRQVKEIMWSELKRHYNNRVVQDAFGRLITCKLELAEDWYILAFTTKETGGKVGKFQGFHAAAVMIVVSEAQAVDDNIFDQIEGITTSEITLLTVLGNPLRNTGRFAQMLRDREKNIVINLNCLDSPNVIEGREVIPGLCSRKWVENKRQKWNADGSGKDPRWMGRVLGQVPTTSINTVISYQLYDSCIGRSLTAWSDQRRSIGVDPGLTGNDDMVITGMESGRIIGEVTIPKCEAPEACSHILLALRGWFPDGQCTLTIDSDGLGLPIFQFVKKLIEDLAELQIKMVEFHGCSTDKELIDPQYANLRAQCAFWAKDRMLGGWISMDDNETAREEACEEQYFMSLKGKMQLEDKDDLTERLTHSPNKWDARKLAIWGFKYAEKVRGRDRYRPQRASSMVKSRSFMAS